MRVDFKGHEVPQQVGDYIQERLGDQEIVQHWPAEREPTPQDASDDS